MTLLSAGKASSFTTVRGLDSYATTIEISSIQTPYGILSISAIVIFDKGVTNFKV